MYKVNMYLYGLVVILIFASCGSEGRSKVVDQGNMTDSPDGWEVLFDHDSSFQKWKYFNGGEVDDWHWNDGVLCNSGIGSDHGGDIITKKSYRNFELSLEWKADPGSNSGIFYMVQESDSIRAIYESGPEYQIADDYSMIEHPEVLASQMTGANYGMNVPMGGRVHPAGEWNHSEIKVQDGRVEHWLNGTLVVEYELRSEDWYRRKELSKWKDAPFYGINEEGKIGLQDHGGLTCFRNIRIREL